MFPQQVFCRTTVIGLVVFAGTVFLAGLSGVQAQGYSSPTFAASAEGSPYASGVPSPHSDVYARTFGSSGQTTKIITPSAKAPVVSPSVTPQPPNDLVYVINSKGLLTFRASDFAEGKGEAIAHNPVPLNMGPTGGPAAPPLVPSVADSLYLRPPLETAAGADTPAAESPAR